LGRSRERASGYFELRKGKVRRLEAGHIALLRGRAGVGARKSTPGSASKSASGNGNAQTTRSRFDRIRTREPVHPAPDRGRRIDPNRRAPSPAGSGPVKSAGAWPGCPMCSRMRRNGSASVMNAISRISPPHSSRATAGPDKCGQSMRPTDNGQGEHAKPEKTVRAGVIIDF
jgi:hypothetical protein